MLVKPKPNLHDPLPDGRTHPSVSLGRLYVVTTIAGDEFRIVNDRGEPILVPRARFEIVDEWVPEDWVKRENRAEEWCWSGPVEFAVRGFFERWHNGGEKERKVFSEIYLRLWHHYEQALGDQQLVLREQ